MFEKLKWKLSGKLKVKRNKMKNEAKIEFDDYGIATFKGFEEIFFR